MISVLHLQSTGTSFWKIQKIHSHLCFWGLCLFTTISSFFSTPVGLYPAASAIHATGTDGEKCLVDALAHSFPHACQLQCFHHLQQNIESHLHDWQFPQCFVHNMFGYIDQDGIYHEGLVDCCDDKAYDKLLASMGVVWNEDSS